MRVAVLTLTRDRVDYTRHCFAMLQEHCGCDFDHYVLDQGSQDDTVEWLEGYEPYLLAAFPENVGIHRGWNILLDEAAGGYDVYVTLDNDCELHQPGTLKAVCEAIYPDSGWIASPTVNGLQNPLSPGPPQDANGYQIGETPIVGGICRAIPGSFVNAGFRFNEDQPIWGGDETWIAQQFPGRVGWMYDWSVNHYKTTDGQQAELPDYFARKFSEMGWR